MAGTLLTTGEVAERLGISSAAVAQAVRTGALEPTARTNDDFLFTERAVAAFAERRAEASATPLQPPPAGSRSDWRGDVDRLNSWLEELTGALPAPPAAPVVEPAPPLPDPEAESGLPPAPIVARTILERIAAAQPAAAQRPAPAAAQPPAPAAEPATPEPLPELEVTPPVIWPQPVPVAEAAPAAPAALSPPAEPPATPGVELSRQALLVLQPVVHFRILRDVTDRLATVPGVADARLERLEGGVAYYRVNFASQRPAPDAIGAPLADLNLQVLLVDSFL